MRILFFDTETTHLWNFKEDYNHDSQPDIIQLAASLVEYKDNNIFPIASFCLPMINGCPISKKAEETHKISEEFLRNNGFTPKLVVETFMGLYDKCDLIVAHNFNFDSRLVRRAFWKIKGGLPTNKKYICTMMKSTEYCAIKSTKGFKWPKLEELYLKLFGVGFDGAHNAMNDVNATMRCFFELVKLGVVKLD